LRGNGRNPWGCVRAVECGVENRERDESAGGAQRRVVGRLTAIASGDDFASSRQQKSHRISRWREDLPECNSIRTLAAGAKRSSGDRHVNRASAEPARKVPGGGVVRRRSISAEPEVIFRIVHVALDDGSPPTDASPPPSYREQTVEVALGPNPTFRNGGVGALMRRVPLGQVVNAVPPSRRKACPRRPPKPVGPPRIVETLRKAIEWRRQLDAGEVPNQAAIARREGITRARVTQIVGLLRLAPAIQDQVLVLMDSAHLTGVSEQALRPIAQLHDPASQMARYRTLCADGA